jgi:hypothetical protein
VLIYYSYAMHVRQGKPMLFHILYLLMFNMKNGLAKRLFAFFFNFFLFAYIIWGTP